MGQGRSASLAAGVLAVASLMAGVLVCGQSSGSKYHAAGIAQASDIAYPMGTKTPGFVTLDVGVDASGAPQNITVVRDVPPLTDAAKQAVNGWQFAPATTDAKSVPGIVRVTIAFNPYNPGGVGLPAESLQPAQATNGGSFQPAGLQKASYANYPPNTTASGTVVLRVRVSHEGKVRSVTVLRGNGTLGDAATAAAKTWAFTPATYQGQAVASDVVVAFVFASPQAGTR